MSKKKKVIRERKRPPSSPGEILRSGFIESYDIRIETVAALLGVTRGHLSGILNGQRPLTVDMAFKLQALTKVPATQWLVLEGKYQAHMRAENKEYILYEKHIDSWSKHSLGMPAEVRRKDPKTGRLVRRVYETAKDITKQKQQASH